MGWDCFNGSPESTSRFSPSSHVDEAWEAVQRLTVPRASGEKKTCAMHWFIIRVIRCILWILCILTLSKTFIKLPQHHFHTYFVCIYIYMSSSLISHFSFCLATRVTLLWDPLVWWVSWLSFQPEREQKMHVNAFQAFRISFGPSCLHGFLVFQVIPVIPCHLG